MLPLTGITVLALEQAVAAPFATRQLADLGARVIKVERPNVGDFARSFDASVDGMSSYFVWLNRSKESLTLNLQHPEAQEILAGLLKTSDIFIQNLAPGATSRMGLATPELQERYPQLIVCDVSGYGTGGPLGGKKAYDLLIQCETGLVSITGTDATPSKAGISVADIAAGMYAFSGCLLALLERQQNGHGSAFEVSLFDCLAEWMSAPAYFAAYGGRNPPRTGASHATIAPYGPFMAGDGRTVFLGLQNEREWERFCAIALERPELTHDARFRSNAERVHNIDILRETIDSVFCNLDLNEVMNRLERAGIATARLNSPRDFWQHPQLQERGRSREVESPVGTLQALLPPITRHDSEARMDAIPALGEHTEAILLSLGYDADRIAHLRSEFTI